jgi:3-deoxy-manno-octulosonate cytidylyltransferase (CMP-KDO synthetase)
MGFGMNKAICLIPSRLASKRLPGKALIEIRGLPLIIHVAKRAQLAKSVHEVYVCTDSSEIARACTDHDIPHIITDSTFRNGTERIASVADKFRGAYIVDVQGDEPLINPAHVDDVVDFLTSSIHAPDIVIPTLKTVYNSPDSIVRVLSSRSGRVLNLTRATVPHPFAMRPQFINKHLSIIGFKPGILEQYSQLETSYLEEHEDIELLRAVENDFQVYSTELSGDSLAVDLESDLIRARVAFESDPIVSQYLN